MTARIPAPAAAPEPEQDRGREGWWFAPAGPAPRAGRAETCPTLPAPGEVGLHAARTVLDALEFARSTHLCRVRLGGVVAERGPLVAATERTVLWCLDPTPLLRSIVIEIARGALREDAPLELDAVATRPRGESDPASIDARCDRARDAVLDAESRVHDAEWRLERRGGEDAFAEARAARSAAAGAKARLHALDALRVGARGAPHELGSAIELALRANAWARAASLDAISARALDELVGQTRARWAETIDGRVHAIASAREVDRPPAEPLAAATEPGEAAASARPSTVIAPIPMALPAWRATARMTWPIDGLLLRGARSEPTPAGPSDTSAPAAEPEPPMWSRSLVRCRECGVLSEVMTDDPIELAMCRCGRIALERIEPASPPERGDHGDAVACRHCARWFFQPLPTEHVCCPHCLRVARPRHW